MVVKSVLLGSDGLDSHLACHLPAVWPWGNALTPQCLRLVAPAAQRRKQHILHRVAVSSPKKAWRSVFASRQQQYC